MGARRQPSAAHWISADLRGRVADCLLHRPLRASAGHRHPSDPWRSLVSQSTLASHVPDGTREAEMGPERPNPASMGPDQQSWDFLGRPTLLQKAWGSAPGLLAVFETAQKGILRMPWSA